MSPNFKVESEAPRAPSLRNPSREPGKPKSLTWADIQEVRRKYDQLALESTTRQRRQEWDEDTTSEDTWDEADCACSDLGTGKP